MCDVHTSHSTVPLTVRQEPLPAFVNDDASMCAIAATTAATGSLLVPFARLVMMASSHARFINVDKAARDDGACQPAPACTAMNMTTTVQRTHMYEATNDR